MDIVRFAMRVGAMLAVGCATADAGLSPLGPATSIGVGAITACATLGSGGTHCWGGTSPQSRALGRTTDGRAAGPVAGLDGVLTHVAVAVDHACALTLDGRLWCWGSNDYGELGIGASSSSTQSPVRVDSLHDVGHVSVGGAHSCAVAGGGAFCWGANASGQVGDGSTEQRDAPVPVTGLGAAVQRIDAGGDWYLDGFSCAVAGGAASCWGANWAGQLGNGSTSASSVPVPVVGLGAGTTDISAGTRHACAVRDGAAWCWGENVNGQLGDGTTAASRVEPVRVVNATSDIAAVAAGSRHSCALRHDGSVWCWGNNDYGQLGDGTHQPRAVATPVVGLDAFAMAIGVGNSTTCALLVTGYVQCFGLAPGIGFLSPRVKPVAVALDWGAIAQLSAGGSHTCGTTGAGAAFCFGNGESGQLGTGGRSVGMWPAGVSGLGSGVAQVSAGRSHSCSRTQSGAAFCWGAGGSGQLGNATTIDALFPAAVVGLTTGVSDLAASGVFSCGVVGGVAKCWGDNGSGALGVGAGTSGTSVPVAVTGLGADVARVAAGGWHACALRNDGGLKCWGENWRGQVGDSSLQRRYVPVDVIGLNSGVVDLALGEWHSCALRQGGTVLCWGFNESGQVGDGTNETRPVAIPVNGLPGAAVQITAGAAHSCALMQGGEVRCWGANQSGQVGPGSTQDQPARVPVAVPIGEPAYGVAAGASHTCALIGGGRALCWGDARDARLGNGDVETSPVPRYVVEGDFSSSVALTSDPNPSANAQYVTIEARVSASEVVPEGTVVFRDGPTPLPCAGDSSSVRLALGVATCTVPLMTGMHDLRAEYGGSMQALPSSAVHPHVVGAVPGQHCAGFDDVDATDPFCRDVEWLRNRAITFGCTPLAYCKELDVSRMAMAAYLDRLGAAYGPAIFSSAASYPALAPSQYMSCFHEVPVADHPRRVVVDAVVSGVGGTAASLDFRVLARRGFQYQEQPIGPMVTATVGPARPTAIRFTGGAELDAGSGLIVGFAFEGAAYSFTLSDVRCLVRSQVFDRQSTHSPFEASQGATP